MGDENPPEDETRVRNLATSIASDVLTKVAESLRRTNVMARPVGYDCRGKAFTCGDYTCTGVVGCSGEFGCTIKFSG